MHDTIETSPLSGAFGVKVHNLRLSDVTKETSYPALRALFEAHSALLFEDQHLTAEEHFRFGALWGPIEDRKKDERKPGAVMDMPLVSNETKDGVSAEMDLQTLNLKANQQWHIDSTFLPVPALCNILTAKVVTSKGGQTELASSRAAWAAMPEPLKARIRGKVLGHNYRRSRERLSQALADLPMFNKWPAQRWPAVWTNPVNGAESLFIASHVFEVEGMDQAEGDALIEELMAFCTQPQFVYAHNWKVGDVLMWDQRAVLHRGMPWPYDEPRTLAGICCSLSDSDGLAAARSI
ncbi:TauD/TfdA dioxygenase family protein [Tateyamaria pelophila]|uniref:TauD/TfdA dioxygenase family protein n=1 Tax=Tateyamaria pelophila TaxID=328415 RepID=UPI001CBB041C|nr:TauD/TfdA family dioxygenase [Tateyamaria pelophila]